jgi:hypothetical protein
MPTFKIQFSLVCKRKNLRIVFLSECCLHGTICSPVRTTAGCLPVPHYSTQTFQVPGISNCKPLSGICLIWAALHLVTFVES